MTRLRRSMTSRSATIMTISESGKGDPRSMPKGVETVPAGLPEASVLARMANEFFTALPGFLPVAESVLTDAQRAASVTDVAPAGIATAAPASLTSVPTAGLPSELELRTLPTTSALPPIQAQIPAIPGTAFPEIPGGVTETRYGGASSLSFLDEIRPIFAYPAGMPLPIVPQASAVSFPSETELQSLANSFSGSVTPQL